MPRTDTLLAGPELAGAVERWGRTRVKSAVRAAQQRCRDGALAPESVAESALAALRGPPVSGRAVVNATGVLLHTNLGRATLADEAITALTTAAGPTDVEFDLEAGVRSRRGRGALAALAARVPAAAAVHVVNNNAAALVLTATAVAAGREIIVSRGELVEIGDGFRLPALLESTGARIHEVGTTNRTSAADYRNAVDENTAMILKVHPSNFTMTGFTAAVDVAQLSGLGVPVVVDTGSGLLAPEPALPEEPDAASALAAGAALVLASGDKLLGGPQAGLMLGEQELVRRCARHPLARALRADKLTLAALEATLRAGRTPTSTALHEQADVLRVRAEAIAAQLDGIPVSVAPSQAVIGGGGAPGVPLPSWCVELPERYAQPLRTGADPVVGRVRDDRCVLDLRAIPAADDTRIVAAVRACG